MNNITGKALDILKGQKLGFGPAAVNEVSKVFVYEDRWYRRPWKQISEMMVKACREKSFHRFKEKALQAPEETDIDERLTNPARQSERIVSGCNNLL